MKPNRPTTGPSFDPARMEQIYEHLQRNDKEAAWKVIQELQQESYQITAKVLFERTKPIQ